MLLKEIITVYYENHQTGWYNGNVALDLQSEVLGSNLGRIQVILTEIFRDIPQSL
jgi:hypothetical protein